MPVRRRSRSRRVRSRRTSRRRVSYRRKRSTSRNRSAKGKPSKQKVKNLGKAGKSKARIELMLRNPGASKLFGIPKGTNRAIAVPLSKANSLEVKVTNTRGARRVRLTGKGPGGMKLNRFIGVA